MAEVPEDNQLTKMLTLIKNNAFLATIFVAAVLIFGALLFLI